MHREVLYIVGLGALPLPCFGKTDVVWFDYLVIVF